MNGRLTSKLWAQRLLDAWRRRDLRAFSIELQGRGSRAWEGQETLPAEQERLEFLESITSAMRRQLDHAHGVGLGDVCSETDVRLLEHLAADVPATRSEGPLAFQYWRSDQ